AGQVHDFDPSPVIDRKDQRRMDRYMQFGLVAAREAMHRGGLPARLEGELSERPGVILGTGLGGVGTLQDGFATDITRGPDRISPFLIAYGSPHGGVWHVAIRF